MTDKEILALISLLEDDDRDIRQHVEGKILSLGADTMPLLEKAWLGLQNESVQSTLSLLMHQIRFEELKKQFVEWKEYKQDNLLWGLWLVSTFVYPSLSYNSLVADLEQLYYDVWIDFRKDQSYFEQIKILNSALFDKAGFRPNVTNFQDVSNSIISDVLKTRKGNPISLCCVYLLIAQKLELPVFGVNLPQLFILTFKNENLHFYINAFNRGITFTKQDVVNFIREIKLPLQPSFFEPCSHLDIVCRFLRNMVLSYQKQTENADQRLQQVAQSRVQELTDILVLLGEPQNDDQA